MDIICKRIKEERKKQGLTQAQLGDKIGVCSISVCKLESGKNVTTKILYDACNALNLKLYISN